MHVWHYKRQIYLDRAFRRMRKKTAHSLGNPRLLQIHFHTLKYVQLVNLPHEEKFICKVAQNADEATGLIEAGFEYVTGEYDDGGKLFKKRKLSYLGS